MNRNLLLLRSMLIALLLVIGAQGAMATTYLKGSWDDWAEHSADGATGVSITLDAGETYLFGIRDTGESGTGNDWYTNSGTMSVSNCSGWKFEKGSGNASITTTVAGTYVFKVTWQEVGGSWYPYVSVTYPAAVTNYYLKHDWGGNGWSWSALEDNGDGTFSITKAYGGTGCNWNTAASDNGSSYIESPTLVGSPTKGNNCVFTLNPTAGTITITKVGYVAGPAVTFTPAAGSYTDAKSLQVTLSGEADTKTYTCVVTKDAATVATEYIQMSTTSVTKTVYDAKSNGTFVVTVKNPNNEVIATATYTINIETKYDIAVYAYPNTGGTVTPNTTQKVGSTGIEIKATPNTGYEFAGWEVTGGAKVASSSNSSTTLTATDAGTLTANFTKSNDIVLYLKNEASWSGDIYAYIFKGNSSNAAWPGVKMTKVNGNDDYDFQYTVPESLRNGYVIFSNGSDNARFPIQTMGSGLGIRKASHIFNNKTNNWFASEAAIPPAGKHSITITAYINGDKSWYPKEKSGDTDGSILVGTNAYIFAYTNGTESFSAYDASNSSHKLLTDNSFEPAKGKTAANNSDSFGDYCDETLYPVTRSNDSQTLRLFRFVLYYDEDLEGNTAFYTINHGCLGEGSTTFDGSKYLVRQLITTANGNNVNGSIYRYALPSVKLENGASYAFKLSYWGGEHEANELHFKNYTTADNESRNELLLIYKPITIDDDYNCERNTDLRGRTFYNETTNTNVWDPAVSYNINLYRPFYCDGEYETICLPFDVSGSEIEELFGKETQIFEPSSISTENLYMTRITKTDNPTKFFLTAGKPYFLKPAIENRTDYNWGVAGTHGTAFTFYGKEMKYANTYVAYGQQLTYTDADKTWQLKGCFIPTQIGGADRFVNISNSKIFYQQAYLDRSVIRGTRCFFYDSNDTPVTATTTTQKAKKIIIDGFDDETTAIVNPLNGNLIPVKNTKVYNMSGMYVGDNLSSLQKGIYIVDGKKYVVK